MDENVLAQKDEGKMIFITATAFGLALLGYRQLFIYLKGNRYLSWLLAIVLQGLLVYAFSLVKLLKIGIWVTLTIGIIISLVMGAMKVINRQRVRIEFHLFDVLFIIFGLSFSFVLFHSPLIHYDNFTHWSTMVKYLTFVGELPNAHQNLVTFTDYPPAPAMFLTYLTTVVGYQEDILLVGQFMIIWACLYTLFGILRDQKRTLMTTGLFFVISIINVFNIAIRFNNLLVDCLLAVLTVAGVSAVYIHRHQTVWQVFSTSLIINFLLLTKSSAVFFAVGLLIDFAIINFSEIKHSTKKLHDISKKIGIVVLTTGLSLIGWLSWRIHVSDTFTKISKHALNLHAYESQLDQESTNTRVLIVRKFVHYILNTDTLFFKGILLVNLALLISWLIVHLLFHKKSHSLTMLIVSDIIIACYVAGVLGMYVVSMPYAEAIKLAGIDRYLSTIVIFCILIAGVVILNDFDRASFEPIVAQRSSSSFANLRTKQWYQEGVLFLIIASSVMMLSEINGIRFLNQDMAQALPVKMHRLFPNQNKFNHNKVLLVDAKYQDVNNAYANYVGRYYLFSDRVDGREAFNVSSEQFKFIVQGYQYIVIPTYHQTFSKLAKNAYHDNVHQGIYKVTSKGLKRISTAQYMNE